MTNQKLRKTLAGLILAGALLAVPVSADTYTSNGVTPPSWGTSEDGKTTVDYTVTSNYTVVIPSSLTVATADGSYIGATNNVFIDSRSLIDPTQTLKVTLPIQPFEAKDTTNASTIPFNVSYTSQLGTVTGGGAVLTGNASSVVTLLQQTGAEIAAVTTEDTGTPTTGQAAISATVQAAITPAQAAQADVSGTHTGTIQFAVGLT
ncbi:hypothetical protein FACS1894193_09050 [Bacilli bacterium]|nr:hypothetical protein FACS1894192_08270 [Bacilli bacterium]GHU42926.1 hypothetical protein FACS1894193_09050 [Bacilli bacterium]